MIPMLTIQTLARQLSRVGDDEKQDEPLYEAFYEVLFELERDARCIDAMPADQQEAARKKRVAALRRKYRRDEPYGHLLDIMESVVCRDVEALEPFVSGNWKEE